MKKSSQTQALLLILMCSVFAIPWAWGQSEHSAKLNEGAKKEGEVVVYGTMSLPDFVLSKEGQRTVLNFGRQVARTDLLAEQEVIKNLELVPLDPRSGETMDYHANLAREIFQQ